MTTVISIVSAEYINNYSIRFVFSDNTEKTIDFAGFLMKSKNPMTRKYLDKNKFRNFSIQYGDVVWNDYEMCFPLADLYAGQI